MATKINPAFYGAENTFIDIQGGDCKRSTYSLSSLFTNNIYTGGQFDITAAPWGCGKSSFTSDYTFFAGKGQNWTVLDLYNPKKNTPMYMYWASSPPISGDVPRLTGDLWSVSSYTRGLYKARMSPNTKYSNGSFRSTLSIDNNQSITIGSTDVPFYPITYLDYQKIRAVITDVWYKPEGATNNQKTTMSAIKNGTVSVDTIVAFKVLIYHKDSPSNTYPLYIGVGGAELDLPELYQNCYYGTDVDKWVRTWRYVQTFGYWELGSSSYGYQYASTDSFNTTSWFNDRNSSDKVNRNSATSAWGHIMPDTQTFDDVTYTWHTGLYVVDTNDPQNLSNKIANGDLYANGTVGSYAYMSFDEYLGDKNAAAFNAILHEVAYIGLPFTYSTDYVGQPIGGNDIYLPIFDHMVTTGRFESGTRSLTLENATWNNVFGVDMPTYDPEYDPDTPTPPEPEDDYGYLNNKPITNRVYSSNNRVYALTAAQYSQFINDVNSLYLDNPDTGYASFQLDFKGTNPSDYIVGTYGYTFLPAGLIPNQQPEAIQIGAVTLPNAKGYKIAPSYIYNARILGVIDLTGAGDFKPFGDFRDFEPYTHIELYIPLCGNVELDPAAVVGHTIQIEIIFDIMTGNATACVYRDDQTLIATVAGQLAASLPLTSGRMGDYQNAVKSAENALKQNELKTTTAAASVAFGVGAALLAPETGGLSLAAYGAAMTGGASLMSLSNQKNQIEYEIKHKQPSISVCSSANGAVAQNISSMYAVCYVKQCKLLSSYNAATYAHTVGHATVKNTTIGAETTVDSNSLIVCSNADLTGIPATAAEINAIQSLLTGGVYV
jgi:hypothetical protein